MPDAKYRVHYITKRGRENTITIGAKSDDDCVRAILGVAGVRSLEDMQELEIHAHEGNVVRLWRPITGVSQSSPKVEQSSVPKKAEQPAEQPAPPQQPAAVAAWPPKRSAAALAWKPDLVSVSRKKEGDKICLIS